MDRFSQGLADPQEAPLVWFDCAFDACEEEMPAGSVVWSFDNELYCSGRCLLQALGAERKIAR